MINPGFQYLPLKLSLSFLIITELLVWLGPIDYQIKNPFMLIFYLIILNVSLFYGYRFGVTKFKPSTHEFTLRLLKILVLLGLMSSFYNLYINWTAKGIPISISSLITALTNPGKVYSLDTAKITQSSVIVIFMGLFHDIILPIGVMYWKHLNKYYRFYVVLAIIIQIVFWLGIGTRKGLFDIMILFILFSLMKSPDFLKKNVKAISVIVVLFLFYFVYSNVSRSGHELSDVSSNMLNQPVKSFYLDYFPLWLNLALMSITSYLCQGYYALSLALDIGIIPPKPLSMNAFTAHFSSNFGYDAFAGTYLDKLEAFGIDRNINWHTAYVWFANEFTFIFVPLIVFFIGYFLAQSWLDSLKGKNYLSFPIFSYMFIMALYLYANNQVFSSSFLPFLFWFFLYQFSRGAFTRK